MDKKQIGYYCWAGPGTIRMIKLKYFNPKINTESVMSSYEDKYLKRVKEVFGITDFWASYSWGFADKTEKEDREFLLNRVNNFKKNNLKLHVYIQGTNLVYEDFKDKDWWCQDNYGRLIPYHKGRKMACVNNPEFRQYLNKKIKDLYNKGVDGAYIDNIFNGLPALPIYKNHLPIIFAGCTCKYCQKRFKEQTGKKIPTNFIANQQITEQYLKFRVDSTTAFLAEVAQTAKDGKMEFGTNSSNPHYSGDYFYGYDLKEKIKLQNYILFEPVSFPQARFRAIFSTIEEVVHDFNKPTFVVAYKQHIGIDSEYSQQDFDLLFTEANKHKFNLCIKGSEYVTKGVWHNLDIDKYSKPKIGKHSPHGKSSSAELNLFLLSNGISRRIIDYGYVPAMQFMAERKSGRYIINKLAKH